MSNPTIIADPSQMPLNGGGIAILAQKYGNLSYDPIKGYRVGLGYRGTFDGCFAYANNSLAKDVAWNIDHEDGPIYSLVANIPDLNQDGVDTPTPTLTYELVGRPQQKSIYEAPFVLALDARNPSRTNATTGKPELYSQLVQRLLKDDPPSAPDGTDIPDASALDIAVKLYNLVKRGTDSFQTKGRTFKLTKNVSSRYLTKSSFANEERVYSTAQLKAEVLPPPILLFSLDAAAAEAPSPYPGYTWGWLKQLVTVSQAAGLRFNVTNEYILEQWFDLLYPAPTTAIVPIV